jgi:hypothetical protein
MIQEQLDTLAGFEAVGCSDTFSIAFVHGVDDGLVLM